LLVLLLRDTGCCCRCTGLLLQHVGEDGIAFVRKVYKLIGMSPTRTFLPPWVNPQFIAKPEVSLDRAHDEAMVTVVGTARQLLQKAGKCQCPSTAGETTPVDGSVIGKYRQ
jgi:hypothetical protein